MCVRAVGEVAGGREAETRFMSSIPECYKRNEIMKGELPPDLQVRILRSLPAP